MNSNGIQITLWNIIFLIWTNSVDLCSGSGYYYYYYYYYGSEYYYSSSSSGIVAGIILGSMVAFVIIGLICLLCIKYYCKTKHVINPQTVPYTIQGSHPPGYSTTYQPPPPYQHVISHSYPPPPYAGRVPQNDTQLPHINQPPPRYCQTELPHINQPPPRYCQ